MKYFIMLGIVVAVALADWLTGFIKAYVQGNVSSKIMRTGGMKKLAEIVVMLVGIVLDIGVNKLSTYYPQSDRLASIIGIVCAVVIFSYIVLMEVISILENYAAIFPEAAWAVTLSKKLKNIDISSEKEEYHEQEKVG
jgi:phage-related holin